MKYTLGAASAVAILFAAGSALAQAPAPEGAPAPAPGFGIQGDAAAGAAADVGVDTIVAALNNTQGEITGLSSLPASATIEVVYLDEYMQGDGAATLTPAIAAAEGQADALKAALQANTTVMAQLQTEGVNIDDVVGFGIEGSNLFVFVQGADDDGAAAGAAAGAGMGGAGGGAAPAPAAP
jgi:hypothetical protein